MVRLPFVVRSADVPEVEGAYPAPFDAEKLSFGRDIGRAAGSRALGVWRERIPPGRRTSFTHAHQREEEAVYVLAGRPSVRWIAPGGAPAEHELAPGDFVSFPAGTGIAHTVVNRGPVDAELLVIGERRTSERVTYPEDAAYQGWFAEHHPQSAWTDVAGPLGAALWPAWRIETERAMLRTWTVEDAPALIEAQSRNRDHLATYIPWAQDVPSLDVQRERILGWMAGHARGGDLVYGVCGFDGRLIGGAGIHDRVGPLGRELGYWVDHAHEGKGLVTEWCAALVRLCFEVLGLDRVEIRCAPENVRSAAVARRLGFTLEVTLPRRVLGADGLPRDSQVWVVYRDGFRVPPGVVRAWDAVGRRLL